MYLFASSQIGLITWKTLQEALKIGQLPLTTCNKCIFSRRRAAKDQRQFRTCVQLERAVAEIVDVQIGLLPL